MDIRSENGKAIAVLTGDIDHHSARKLRSELDSFVITMQPDILIIDLTSISFMDSSGIGLIIGRYKLLKELGGKLEVKSPQPYIRRVLRLSGIERIVKIL
ncbi:MAG: STAS domain-containing protein [Ruminococcus sp.]|nr:STAS domain-containing protein [Ruminococcus sp.]